MRSAYDSSQEAAQEGVKLSFSSRFHIAFDASFHKLTDKYKRMLSFFFKRKWVVGSALALACVALIVSKILI
jgi:multidrug efflux pump subunit AcrB